MQASDPLPTLLDTATPVLRVRGLEITFETDDGPLKAADGVSLDLLPGQTLALVGESGCGKSVSALSLLGLVPQPGRITAGSIEFRGTELTELSEKALREVRGNGISMVFQEPMTSLNPVFSVGTQIAEAYRLHHRVSGRQAWAEAVAMLERVGIPDARIRARSFPHQLSGGMRQRAMIAMALVCRPEVLIADEPTTALDVTIQGQILDLILAMQRDMGMAILFISHDLGVVSEVADEVAVMYAGRVVERASAQDLFRAPLHPYTRGLIETLPGSATPGGRLPAIPGTVPDLRELTLGCRFAARCPLADDHCRALEPPPADPKHPVSCWKAVP